MSRVAVLGISGRVGSRIATELLRRGHAVTGIAASRPSSAQIPYPAWQDFLGNPALTKALLSRLRERCHTVVIDGPCLRPQTG